MCSLFGVIKKMIQASAHASLRLLLCLLLRDLFFFPIGENIYHVDVFIYPMFASDQLGLI